MKREELLTDAMLFFSPNERSITAENGARYYREDVVLKAMELAGKETPQPTAEGAEEILHKYVHTINSDGTSLVTFMGALKAMREFAAQQQPPAEGAEEILASLVESLGEPDNSVTDHSYQIRPLTVEGKREWWMFHNGVGSGEPLAQWLGKFATLHAQKIADKMVEERIILDEEMAEPVQDALYATGRFTIDECNVLTEGILMYIKERGIINLK